MPLASGREKTISSRSAQGFLKGVSFIASAVYLTFQTMQCVHRYHRSNGLTDQCLQVLFLFHPLCTFSALQTNHQLMPASLATAVQPIPRLATVGYTSTDKAMAILFVGLVFIRQAF